MRTRPLIRIPKRERSAGGCLHVFEGADVFAGTGFVSPRRQGDLFALTLRKHSHSFTKVADKRITFRLILHPYRKIYCYAVWYMLFKGMIFSRWMQRN